MIALHRVAAFTRVHPESMLLINDHRWLYDQSKPCVQNSLGINLGTSPQYMQGFLSGRLSRVWNDGLLSCGNGCGCSFRDFDSTSQDTRYSTGFGTIKRRVFPDGEVS